MSKIEHDDITGTATTGHEWDGIKELNTPLPRWWLYTFYATIAWAAVYTVLYPAWPLLNGATPGILGYSSRAAVSESIAQARAAQGEQLQKIASASVDDILKDPALLEFARAGGAAAFKVNCVQCHGSGAAGGAGYPNLNDDDWLWGGTADQIHTTLRNGIRYTLNGETRDSQMPAFGVDGILTPEQIADVANYPDARGRTGRRHGSRARQAALRRQLRLLPRRGRQGPDRLRRAEPHRLHLALRQRAGSDHGADPQAAAGRDAGLGRTPRRCDGKAAGRLCSLARRRPVGQPSSHRRVLRG
jgi:cbb3-type cytochrome c oxidase subunit III